MAEIVLDGRTLETMEEVHERFAPVFPAYYGRNLDALFDCLTDCPEALTVRLLPRDLLEDRLGRRGQGLTRLLRRAAVRRRGAESRWAAAGGRLAVGPFPALHARFLSLCGDWRTDPAELWRQNGADRHVRDLR